MQVSVWVPEPCYLSFCGQNPSGDTCQQQVTHIHFKWTSANMRTVFAGLDSSFRKCYFSEYISIFLPCMLLFFGEFCSLLKLSF